MISLLGQVPPRVPRRRRFSLIALMVGASLVALGPSPNLCAEPPHAAPSLPISPPPPPALTDAQKNQIRAEELFRRQVAKEIAAEEGKGFSWWSVLNSSFALWFLSSVVISGLTAAVAVSQKRHADKKQKQDLQTRLATEISYRIDNGLVAMHLDNKRVAAGSVYSQDVIYNEALAYLNNTIVTGSQQLDFSIYQDYKTRRFLSLLFELRGSVDSAQLALLKDANQAYAALEALADDSAIQNLVADKTNALAAVAQAIRWLEKLRDNTAWKDLS